MKSTMFMSAMALAMVAVMRIPLLDALPVVAHDNNIHLIDRQHVQEPTRKLSGHRVPLVLNVKYKKDFKAQIAKLHKRYPSLMKRAAGRVPITNVQNDLEYYGSVLVGTPGQEVKLNFDTGSSDIWFPSSTCSSAECGKHVRFDASKSSTYQNDGRSWTISYGDGSKASGYLGSDMVNVGGIAVRQTIGLATKESSHFESSEEDGLFGLGFNTIQTVRGVKTFMDNAVAAGLVDQPVVSVFLPSVRRNGGKGGEYLFGAIDASKFQGALTYVPVTRRGYWQVLVQDVAYNGQSIGQSSQAIIDTGATLVMVGDTVAKTIHDKIEGAFYDDSENGWVVPCSITSRSGDVSFKMGGASFKVPLADLAYQERSGRAGGSDHFCYSGIQGGQDGLWILGDIFIKNNYCVFSQASPPSVGIAPLAY